MSSHGIRVPGDLREVVDVRFGDERIWSFNPERERAKSGTDLVRWPAALQPYLDGVAEVSVVRHLTGETVHEERVGFGTGTDPIRLVSADGHAMAVDKGGRLQRMFSGTDRALRDEVLDALERVLHDLREECGLEAFLAFGCLLGAVRDGHMIGHDSDVDVSYLSRHTHPFDIIRENKRAEETMAALGWEITRMSAGDFKIWTHPGGSRRVGIDVFTAFYVDDAFYQMPTVTGALDRSALLPVGEVLLEGRPFVAPARPEALLEVTYGPQWRVPDPSFSYDPSRALRRRFNGWLRGNRMHLRSWGRFYRSEASSRVPTTPSPFAVWVADRIEPGQHVLDVGCGNGRDAVHLAERGHVVEALDGTSAAQRLTDQLARKHAVEVHPRPLNLNDLFSTLSTGARFAHAERPPHIYARFLLEAIETDARRNFYRWAQMIQRRGGRTFLEFRVRDQARDPQEPRRTPTHYRAHLDAARVVAQIERYGGTVEHREEGVDLAPSRRENPRTCRLVVRWT